ncbi:MAG: beta-galactosidase [Aggregatilineales bacterium]
MFIGTQYHRKPHPAKTEWARDLANVSATGLALIRVWITWSQVNPRPDQWDWDELDGVFDAAAKQGVKVCVQLMPDGIPFWFKDAHPEALLKDEHGNILYPTAHPAMGVGGVPGPNFDHPVAQQALTDFFTQTIRRYRSHSALDSWDVWNELWPFMGAPRAAFHSDATIQKWRAWLQQQYGTIEILNAHWSRTYGSFDEVEWVTSGIYADLGTRMRFDQDRVADWMHFRVALARQLDPDHKIIAHTGGIGPVAALNDPWNGELTDPWLFTRDLDVWGVSVYLRDFREWSFMLDSNRSAAQGRTFWVCEMNGGRGHYAHPGEPGPGFYSNYVRSKEEVRSQVLLSFSHGAKGAIFWQWRPEHFGGESPGWGLTTAAGELTERTEGLREIAAMLKAHGDLFEQMTLPDPQVAIVWEPRSYQAERLANWKPGFGYLGGFELFGYHRAFTSLGLRVEYLHARTIIEQGIPKSVKLLVHPYPVADRSGLAAAITSWVRSGGTFVAGPGVGLFDEQLNGSFRLPPDDWRTLLGVCSQEMRYPESPALDLLPTPLTGNARRLPGYHLIENFVLDGAEPLGVWQDQVALTVNAVGSGRAISVGTFLGQPLSIDQKPALIEWIDALCVAAEVRQSIHITSEHAFSRLAYAGDTSILFVHNPLSQPVQAWISTSEERKPCTITNLLSDNAIGTLDSSHPLAIGLGAKDSGAYAIH